MMRIRSIESISDSLSGFVPGHIQIQDQTQLPDPQAYIETKNLAEVSEAI